MAAKRKRRSPRSRLLIAGLVAAAFVLVLLWRGWYGAGPLEKPAAVVIPQGASLGTAARALETAGAVRDAESFRRFAGLLGSDDPIRTGEYAIPAHASPAAILDILQHGRALQRFVTVPEGTPSIVVHRKLMAEPLLAGTVAVPAEGSVLPDSYSFQRGDTRASVLGRMQAAMAKTLDAAWKARKPTAAVRSKRDALILASIVEKETGVPSERRMVAAVYSNRLRAGMPLQADPTVIYPVTRGLPLGRRILRSELLADNGYNTYARRGLPAGPIANPGKASIQAVLDPAPSGALYFVANGKGGHVFAATLAEHNANVAKWYAIRRTRGEM